MAAKGPTSRWKVSLAAAAAMFALACGGDDDGGSKDNNNDDGDQPTPATGATLDNGVVGKACTSAADCGSNGRCATEQGLGMLGDFLTQAGLSVALSAPGGYCTTACSSNANCGEGGVCFGAIPPLVQGECRKSCAANTDCREGYECAKPQMQMDDSGGVLSGVLGLLPAQCLALPKSDNLGPNVAGSACSDQADAGALATACGEGRCLLGACTGTCISDATCGAGAVCVSNGFYGSVGTCQESCAVDTDCAQYKPDGSGTGCIDVNGRKLCGPKLFPLPANTLGKACTGEADCGNGECATLLGLSVAPEGYCTLLGCQDDSVCTGGACVGTLAPLCYDSCTSDTECRPGYACVDRTNRSNAPVKVCAPAPVTRDAGAPPAPSPVSDAGV